MADIDRRRLALENRQLALSKIDDAPFSWVDVRYLITPKIFLILVVSWLLALDCISLPQDTPNLSSFTDAYQLFAVAFAVVMFAHVYNPETGDLAPSLETAIKIASSVGTVIGQIGFGFLSDLLGRKKVVFFPVILDSRCTEWNW